MTARVDDTITLADGRTLGYAEYGDANGDALFFFHGLPGSRKLGGVLDEDAASLGVRIVAPERPGFGQSTFEPTRTFASWADDVRQLADHLGIDRFYVAGISGGGPYTLACAHGLGDRVRAAGVISGGGEIADQAALDGMHAENRAIFQLAFDAGFDGVKNAMAPMLEMLKSDEAFDAQMSGLPDADKELLARRPDVKEAMKADGVEALAQGADGAAYECCMFVKPWGFDVSEIRVPVVIWHGDDDRNAPLSHAQALADRMPHAELIVWEGMGHLTAIDRVKEIFGHLVEAG
jgi:pimeloyl-ACP methyl ester carboxylesterase